MNIRNGLLYGLALALGIGGAFKLVSLTATLPDGTLTLTKTPQQSGNTYWVLSQKDRGKDVLKGTLLTNCAGQFVYLFKPTEPTSEKTTDGKTIYIKEQYATFWANPSQVETAGGRFKVIGAEEDNQQTLADPAEGSNANILDVEPLVAPAPMKVAPLCVTNAAAVEKAVFEIMAERLGLSAQASYNVKEFTLQEQALTPRGREIATLKKLGDSPNVIVLNMVQQGSSGHYDFMTPNGEKAESLNVFCLGDKASAKVGSDPSILYPIKGLCTAGDLMPNEDAVQEIVTQSIRTEPRQAFAFLQEKDGRLDVTYRLPNGYKMAQFYDIECPAGTSGGYTVQHSLIGPWQRHIGHVDGLSWCAKNRIDPRTVKAVGARMLNQIDLNGKRLGLGLN